MPGRSALNTTSQNAVPLEAAATLLLRRWRRRTGAPALAGVVVGPEGILWIGAQGRRRLFCDEVVAESDRWHLGSNTEAMTAALYARLVQGGLARWDMSMSELFPDLAINRGWEPITIAELLRHRSGLQDKGLSDLGWLPTRNHDATPIAEQRTALAARVLGPPPGRRPGSFAYASSNYVVAGAAIERLACQSWESASQAWLFAPLGMTSVGFGAPRGDQPWGHPARFMGFGVGHPVDPSGPADNPAILAPAGGVHTSLGDYAKFLRLFLNEGGGFLTRANMSALTTPPTDDDRDYAFGWGTFRHRIWSQGPAWVHAGSNSLWHSVAIVGPKRGLAVATVSNSGGAGVAATQGLAIDLVRRYAARARS